MAGLASEDSRAAQTGPTRVVTSDTSGNLATADLDLATLTGLGGRVSEVEAGVASLRGDIKRAYAGTAVAIAMGGNFIPPDMNLAVSFNLGTYRGQEAFAATVVARVSPQVWLNAGAAGSSVRGSTGGRAGVTFGW